MLGVRRPAPAALTRLFRAPFTSTAGGGAANHRAGHHAWRREPAASRFAATNRDGDDDGDRVSPDDVIPSARGKNIDWDNEWKRVMSGEVKGIKTPSSTERLITNGMESTNNTLERARRAIRRIQVTNERANRAPAVLRDRPTARWGVRRRRARVRAPFGRGRRQSFHTERATCFCRALRGPWTRPRW